MSVSESKNTSLMSVIFLNTDHLDTMNLQLKIALLLFAFVAFYSFLVLSFMKSVDCRQLVIDTYEMHADVNIPDASFVNCYYDEALNLRISVYDLKKALDLSRFVPVTDQKIGELVRGLDLLNSAEIPSSMNGLLFTSGQKWGRDYTLLYDDQTVRLWAELRY